MVLFTFLYLKKKKQEKKVKKLTKDDCDLFLSSFAFKKLNDLSIIRQVQIKIFHLTITGNNGQLTDLTVKVTNGKLTKQVLNDGHWIIYLLRQMHSVFFLYETN